MQTPDGVPVARWGWRFLAGIVDLILVEIVATVAALPFIMPVVGRVSDYVAKSMRTAEHGGTTPPPVPTDLVTSGEQLWITVITAVVGIAYFAIMWRFVSATLGQLLCGLRIVPLGEGRRTRQLNWGVSVLRAALWSVPLAVGNLLLIFALANALAPLFQSNRQALHDLAVRTQVVKIR